MAIKKVNLKELEALINSKQSFFLKIDTPWCGVCKMNAPMLNNVITKLEGQVEFYSIDADSNKMWAEEKSQWDVKLVPTYMTYKSGKLVWTKNNFVPEPLLLKAASEII